MLTYNNIKTVLLQGALHSYYKHLTQTRLTSSLKLSKANCLQLLANKVMNEYKYKIKQQKTFLNLTSLSSTKLNLTKANGLQLILIKALRIYDQQ